MSCGCDTEDLGLPVGPAGEDGRGYDASSVTSINLGTLGTSQTLTIDTEKAYSAGARVRVSSAANPDTDYFEGVVLSYAVTTGVMVVNPIDVIKGASTASSWNVNLAGDPGIGGCFSVTRSAINSLVATDALVECAEYHITDRYLVVSTVSANKTSLKASYIARNADYQNVGDYADITTANGFTVNTTGVNVGQWYSAMAVPSQGDVAIYNGLHWLSLTGAIGTAPDSDAVNWEPVPNTNATQAETYGYITEIQDAQYDFANDWIQRREDSRGNVVSLSRKGATALGVSTTAGSVFQWGNDLVTGNIVDESHVDCLNQISEFSSNMFGPRAVMKNITWVKSCVISRNTFANGVTVDNKRFTATFDFTDNYFGKDWVGAETITATVTGKRYEQGFSSFVRDVDMDLNFTAGVLTIAPVDEYIGIFRILGSLTSYQITSIVNTQNNHSYELQPAINITNLELLGTAVGGAVADDIVLPLPSVFYDGSTRDCVVLRDHLVTGVIYHIDSKQYI